MIRSKAFKSDDDDFGQGLSVYSNPDGSNFIPESVEQFLTWASRNTIARGIHLGVCNLQRLHVQKSNALLLEDPNEPEDDHQNSSTYETLHGLIQCPQHDSRCPGEAEKKLLAMFATQQGNIVLPVIEVQS